MERRAQFSILFTDEGLFDNFIVYQKQQKTLKPLVLKLLTSYYYDDEVRRLIDGSDEEEEVISSAQEEAMAYFEQCRQSLALMNVYAEGLEDLTDDSIDKFGEFADNVATKTGGKASTATEFGQSVPQIEMISQRTNQTSNEQSSGGNNTVRSDEYKELENRIEYLTDLVLSLTKNISGASGVEVENKPQVEGVQNSQTYVVQPQVGITNENEVQETVTTVHEKIEKPVEIVKEEPSQPEVVVEEHKEEVDSGFDDLLASAGIRF